jgi:hypothetical protein
VAAAEAAAGKTATLTLSPSFTMAGYVAKYGGHVVAITTNNTVLTIEGHGATFNAAGRGYFFFLTAQFASLTVRNVTMKNGYDDDGGAIKVGGCEVCSLTLDACTLINNTSPGMDAGGALRLNGGNGWPLTIKGCNFAGPISQSINDISSSSYVTFACPDGEIGTPVQKKGINDHSITVIPPKELQCTPGPTPAPGPAPPAAKMCPNKSESDCKAVNMKCTDICNAHVGIEQCYGTPAMVICTCYDGTNHFNDVCPSSPTDSQSNMTKTA